MPSDLTTESSDSFHSIPASEVVRHLDVDPARGLSADEVERRRSRFGENRLEDDAATSPVTMLLRQFTDLMIVVLLAACAIAGLIGDALDAIAILVIVVLNGIVGFIQEYRAERALMALQQLSAPQVEAVRDGNGERIAETELVPGDIVLLEAGNVVPADLRVVETADLSIDEAALTGESQPVAKAADAKLTSECALADRITMAYKATSVTRGRARCVVVATGDRTELGRVAQLMREGARPMTPLQKRLGIFGRRLSFAVLAICAIVLAFGLARGRDPLVMFLTAVSLAVAAIPEALPAVVTIALALGARRMAGRNMLVRRLPAVETLGSVTMICCDKTGTLTQNAMRAERFDVVGDSTETLPSAAAATAPWQALGRAMALNNDARADDAGVLSGDPTELAILQAAADAGYPQGDLAAQYPRSAEFAFDSERMRMSTLHDTKSGALVVVKGAPEAVLPLCTGRVGGESFDRDEVLRIAQRNAEAGYRVLAFAERSLEATSIPSEAAEAERDLRFVGLVALADPPRPRVAEALESCRSAGITVAMVTGDHPSTARAIAERLGIGDRVMTGEQLQSLEDAERIKAVAETRVYARVSPEQKFDIVTALQAGGELVAMTGDGVNDAPALKKADIGVAMGLKGTDVAREAADTVLLDDDFATIVVAVREGRRIYDNIRKFIKYTMTSNSGEIWTIFLAPFLGLPLPLLPIQILWINLVTDGLPGLALGVELEERNVMERPPRAPSESVFAHGMWQHMIWVGLLIGALSLGAQAWAFHGGSDNWQTIVFTVLTLSQLVHALAIRSESDSLFTIGWFSNPALFGAVLLTLGLQMAVVYIEPLQAVFKTSALSVAELPLVLGLPWVVLFAVEIEKWLVRRGSIYRAS